MAEESMSQQTDAALPKSKRAYTRRSRTDRRELTIKIWQLKLRGFSIAEIGHALRVPDSTVHYYLQEMRRLNDHEFKDLTSQEVARRLFEQSKMRVQMLLQLYRDTDNPSVKLGCLNSMRAEDEHVVTHGQTLGLIHKEPERYELNYMEIMKLAGSNGHDPAAAHR